MGEAWVVEEFGRVVGGGEGVGGGVVVLDAEGDLAVVGVLHGEAEEAEYVFELDGDEALLQQEVGDVHVVGEVAGGLDHA